MDPSKPNSASSIIERAGCIMSEQARVAVVVTSLFLSIAFVMALCSMALSFEARLNALKSANVMLEMRVADAERHINLIKAQSESLAVRVATQSKVQNDDAVKKPSRLNSYIRGDTMPDVMSVLEAEKERTKRSPDPLKSHSGRKRKHKERGRRGKKGAQGEKGERGIMGLKGEKGGKGEPGKAAVMKKKNLTAIYLQGDGTKNHKDIKNSISEWMVRHLSGCIDYSGGRIKIQSTGLYIVFAQIYVTKGTYHGFSVCSNEQVLMKSIHYTKQGSSIETSNVIGMFRLEKGRQLIMRPLSIGEYDMTHAMVGFGAYRIDSDC